MQTDASNPIAQASDFDESLTRLSASARGWHTIQLAVMGFIGICGVLQRGGSAPRSLQVIGGVLAVAAFAVACGAIFKVGTVAWPLGDRPNVTAQERLTRGTAALHTGIRLTIAALLLIVLATLTGWWPHPAAADSAHALASHTIVEVAPVRH